MGHAFNFADIDTMVTMLRGITGIRSVDIDPAKVNAPGIWVKVEGFELDNLDGLTIRATLYLIAKDSDYVRGGKQAVALYNLITPVIDPASGATIDFVDVAMPDGTVLPALAFPVDLLVT